MTSVAAVCLLFAQNAYADSITFDFTGTEGGTKGTGTLGNTRTFTSGDITLWVTAWGYTYGSNDDALEAARLGRWSTGLGSCNLQEVCADPTHQVDNVAASDWILFVFSEPVDITSLRIDPHGTYDRDVSYYVGNVTIPLDLTGVDYSELAALGFNSLYSDFSTESGAYRDVAISGGFVNALLISGYQGGDLDDYFKIRGLTAITVPEPGSLAFFVSGLLVSEAARRRRSKIAPRANTELAV